MSETKNVTQVKKKHKDKDGKVLAEELIKKNKETGESNHTYTDDDGKEHTVVTNENVHLITFKYIYMIFSKLSSSNNILNQLIEMNYYMAIIAAKLSPDDVTTDKISDHFKKFGIELNG